MNQSLNWVPLEGTPAKFNDNRKCPHQKSQHARNFLKFFERQEKENITSAMPQRKKLLFPVCLAIFGTGIQFAVVDGVFSDKENYSSQIFVLKRTLKRGEIINSDDLELRTCTDEFLAPLYFSDNKVRELIGKRIAVGLNRGEPIGRRNIVSEFYESTVPERIPPGKRLFVLNVPLGRLSEVLRKGDRIDVIGHLNLPEKGFVTKTLLSGIPIVAVGTPTENESARDPDSSALSLYLEPVEIEFLTQAQQVGSFSVALRNPNDSTQHLSSEGMTFSKFLNDQRIQEIYKNDLFQIKSGTPAK